MDIVSTGKQLFSLAKQKTQALEEDLKARREVASAAAAIDQQMRDLALGPLRGHLDQLGIEPSAMLAVIGRASRIAPTAPTRPPASPRAAPSSIVPPTTTRLEPPTAATTARSRRRSSMDRATTS